MAMVITEPCVGIKDKACVPVCPVDCIYPDPEWKPAPEEWWAEPEKDDPYT